jgi:succinate dehydrogenase/fumarate reductase cytochrome b subunit
MDLLNDISFIAHQAAQATGFKGLLGDSLLIGGVSIYESYDNLGAFVNAAFKMTISIGAVVAVAQFVYGGIVYMMTESGAVQMGESKDRMQNALLGLIMLLSTYVIFNQINPDLLNLNVNLEQLPETQRGGGTTGGGTTCTDPNGCP